MRLEPLRRRALVVVLAAASACSEPAASEPPPSLVREAVPTGAAPTAFAARLAALVGDVRIQRAGTDRWSLAHVGDLLRPGDAIQAMAEGSASVVLPDAGGQLDIEAGTTLRMPSQHEAPLVHALVGRVTAHTDPGTEGSTLELRVPPGTLVLSSDAHGPSSATVDIVADDSEVQVSAGTVTLERADGTRVSVPVRRWTRFRADGGVRSEGETGPVAELLTPLDGAEVRTRGDVVLVWSALPGASAYRVAIESLGVARMVDVSDPSLTTALVDGTFHWSVSGLRDDAVWPASRARSLVVDVDRAPPVLTLTEPLADAVTTRASVSIVGRTEPGAIVEARGAHAVVGSDGSFSLDAPLERGLTNLVVRATDACGNVRTVTRSVVRE